MSDKYEHPSEELLFAIQTPLGFVVRVTKRYWNLITTVKHPVMAGQAFDVEYTLRSPTQVRRSKSDSQVFLFYRAKSEGHWICAVTKRLNGEGFLITTYPTDAIKEGDLLWPV